MIKNNPDIPTPSELDVQKYLKIWDSLEDNAQQEDSLNKLFLKTYALNDKIEDVLVKVCALNQFYSTSIRRIFTMANYIVSLNIDDDLKNKNINLVDRIARGHGIRISKTSKESYLYSFATKYCSRHKPDFFPIYDSYVEKIIMYFQDKDNFDKKNFANLGVEALRNYSRFKEVLFNFKKHYNLESFNLKQIDEYLWLAGKEYFPNNYGKKSNKQE